MQHLGTVKLENDRLILRRFTKDDANAMFKNWATDTEVTKYLSFEPHDSIEVSKEVLREWISQYDNQDFYIWAIVLKENGNEPIGGISVVKQDDETEMVQIGYSIGRKWWRQGITSEALSMLITFFFDEVSINRIEARHDPRNPHSGMVMTKCGMQYEGTLREAGINNQGKYDCAMYSILAKDIARNTYYSGNN